MKKSFVSTIAIVIALGFSQASLAQKEENQAPAPGLVELEKGAFQSTWVKPDIDFREYARVVIAQEGVTEYRDVGPAKKSRSFMLRSNESEFGIPDVDRERIERNAGDSFVKAFAKSKHYEVIDDDSVEVPVKGTLLLRGHMLDVVSKVPPPMAGASSVYGNIMGEATLVIELIDAETGKMVGFAAERSKIQRSGGSSVDTMAEVNSVTALAEVRRWASRAGSRLAKALDEAYKS